MSLQFSLPGDLLRTSDSPDGRPFWWRESKLGVAKQVLIFLDAELYLNRVKALHVLADLEEREQFPPCLSVFLAAQGPELRHHDFTCNPKFASLVAWELLPLVWDQLCEGNEFPITLVGLSLSGLAAAHATLLFPERIATAICQSPSFWWNDEMFRSRVPRAKNLRARMWISVGDEETDFGISHPPTDLYQGTGQLESCQRVAQTLRDVGALVNFQLFHGEHDPTCWRDDLYKAIPWAACFDRCPGC
ncbi:MAG: hypothetical protein KDA80_04465 [Planctomycetaceae bacterium]|nr:hypothetical protein [Planctomycetaceae bacterium]